jgi:hypothetical protein
MIESLIFLYHGNESMTNRELKDIDVKISFFNHLNMKVLKVV